MVIDRVRCRQCGLMFEPWTNEPYCSDRCTSDANPPKPLPVGTPVRSWWRRRPMLNRIVWTINRWVREGWWLAVGGTVLIACLVIAYG